MRGAQLVDDDHEDVRARRPLALDVRAPARPPWRRAAARRRCRCRPARRSPGLPRAARRPRSPPFRKVRRSSLLSSRGSMLSMRALILGPAAVLGLGLVGRRARRPPRTGPAARRRRSTPRRCWTESVTVSPLPGSRDASPQTQISFLGVPAGDISGAQRDRLADRRAHAGAWRPTRRATARASCRRSRSPKASRSRVRAQLRARRRAAEPLHRPVRGRQAGSDQLDARDDPPRQPPPKPGLSLAPGPAARRSSPSPRTPPAVAPGDDVRWRPTPGPARPAR